MPHTQFEDALTPDDNWCEPDRPKQTWFAVRTKPHQELRANACLQSYGVTTFLPMSGRSARGEMLHRSIVLEPLFPRYLFALCDSPDAFAKIRFARGVSSIVSTSDGPVHVDQSVVTEIRQRLNKDGYLPLSRDVVPGERLRIVSGPFNGLVGTVERCFNGQQRAELLVAALSGHCRIIVQDGCVERMEG